MRRTDNEFPLPNATPAELRAALLRIADELRQLRVGSQAERIERIVDMLGRPKLVGVLEQAALPKHWITPEGTQWMRDHIMEAAAIIAELMADAEITGSERVLERAKAWLDAIGIVDDP